MRGFALAEVLVAMAVIAMAALFLLSAFPAMTEAIHQSRQRWRAMTYAYDTLESCRHDGYTATRTVGNTAGSYVHYNTLVENGRSFVEGYSSATTVNVIDSRKMVVTVTASWSERGQTRQASISTVMTR